MPKTKKKNPNMAHGKNSPVIGDNGLMLNPGDNTKYLEIQLELFNLPDIDMHNNEEVAARLNEYFMIYAKHDTKPTMAGMAVALNGHSRNWLWSVVNDKPLGGRGNMCTLPADVTETIKRMHHLLENLWETYMQNGKVNPVAGIFLGKNNYGYQDKTECVVTPNTNPDNDYDADDIKARYTSQKRLSEDTDD